MYVLLSIVATDVVNLNVTSAVLDMMQQMNQIWSSLLYLAAVTAALQLHQSQGSMLTVLSVK